MSQKVGDIVFDLSIDVSGLKSKIRETSNEISDKFKKAFNSAEKNAKGSSDKISKSVSDSQKRINAILNDGERSMKSKAASIAAIYRQMGDSQKDAMKKAWNQIDRNSGKFKDRMNESNKGIIDLNSGLKKMAFLAGGAFAAKKVFDFGKQAIQLGSDLTEVQNVVDVTFPKMTKRVDDFAKNAAQQFGLSETMAKRYTGTFGAMAKAFGFGEKQAYDMSTALTGLSGDVASFYNISQDEAYTKLKSVFTGETETLKDLGIVMTQNALDAYAMANGYNKITKEMSEAEKVALRFAFVQQQLSLAAGDFSRTSGSWANQVRLMRLQMEQFMATIGQGFINLFTPILRLINTLLAKILTLANAFKSLTELLTGNKSTQGSGIGAASQEASALSAGLADAGQQASGLGKATDGVGKSAKKAAKEMKALMGFDQINKLDDQSDSGSDGDSGGSGGGPGDGAIQGASVDLGKIAEESSKNNKLLDFFKPIQLAWEKEGKRVMDSWKIMLQEVGLLIQSIGRSFSEVWQNGSGQEIFEHIFSILGSIFQIVGNIAHQFRVAWDNASTGTQIVQSIFDLLNIVLGTIDSIALSTAEWSKTLDFTPLLTSISELLKSLEPLAENIGSGLEWFWKNVLLPLAGFTIEKVIPDFLEILSGALKVLNSVIDALKPLAQWLWDEFLQPLASWTGGAVDTVLKAIADALKSIGDFVDGHKEDIQAIAIEIGSFAAAYGLVNAALTVWNIVAGIAAGVTTALGAAVAFLTSPIGIAVLAIGALIATGIMLWKNWDTISAKAKEIWEALKEWFNQTCQAIGKFFSDLWQGIKDVFSGVGDWFKEKFDTAYNNVQNAFQSIGQWFSQKYEDVKNVFNAVGTWFGDKFKEAYNNVKSVFSGISDFFGGIWDTIKRTFTHVGTMVGNAIGGAVRGVINGVLDTVENTINGGIDLLNGAVNLINKIPGVNIGGFDYLNLPRLAQGGYVKANTPQLAMIGDNKRYGEIVAPENKMLEMARKAAELTNKGGNNDAQIIAILTAILQVLQGLDLTIDGERLTNKVVDTINEITIRRGESPILQ